MNVFAFAATFTASTRMLPTGIRPIANRPPASVVAEYWLRSVRLVIRTEEAVTVPTAAVQRSQNGNYVFIMKDGKAHVQPVNVRRTFQGLSVIESGLTGGEDVITDGQLLLSEGTPVAPRAPKAGA